MIEGASARRVLADKAYASKANRERLRGKHRDGIMRKAARNRPLRASKKGFNKLISKRRFRVEHCFGTMKRLFGPHRARCFGQAKTHAPTGDGHDRADPPQSRRQHPADVNLIHLMA